MTRALNLGRLQLTTISGGRFRLDGGAMFGIVPKPLWQRVAAPDDYNRIALATNCVLVETPDARLLIDTGFGTKLSDREREIHAVDDDGTLVGNLQRQGLAPDAIDYVVLSHLHFDHAGGGTQLIDGEIVPTFPRARYCVQRREWNAAQCDDPEWAGTYPRENFQCLQSRGQLLLLDERSEIVPGVQVRHTGGHSPGHQVVVLESEGQVAVYLGDLCPTWHHLPRMWCMAYDADMMEVRRQKPFWLNWVQSRDGWVLSDHDPDQPMAQLRVDPKRDYCILPAHPEV